MTPSLDKCITGEMLDELLEIAHNSPRRRTHKELHERGADAPIQWFLNVLVPGSYCAPHFHPEEGKWEWFQILRGKIAVLLFDDNGTVISRKELTPSDVCGVEVPPQAWHTIVALEPSVLLELKSGPYIQATDKIFASWAPCENEPHANEVESWYQSASENDTIPSF